MDDNITKKPVHNFLFQIPKMKCVLEFSFSDFRKVMWCKYCILYNTHSGVWGSHKKFI